MYPICICTMLLPVSPIIVPTIVCDFVHGQLVFKGEVAHRDVLRLHEGQHLCVPRVLIVRAGDVLD